VKFISRLLLVTALLGMGARASPLSAQAQGDDRTVRVDSIRVTGNQRLATPVVLADFGVRPGDVIPYTTIQRGIQRLFATQQFDDIRVYAVQGPTQLASSGATLVVEVVERPFVLNYRFEGLEHISSGTIRDTVGLTSNAPFAPAKIHEAKVQIQSELSKKGYVRAQIDTTFVPTDREGEYRLIIRVDEGRRLVVAGVQVEGNEALGDGEVISAMSVKPEGFWWWQSGEFRQEEYNQDLEIDLIEFYGSRGYVDFQVLGDSMIVDPETGKTILVLRVDEGKQYRIRDFQIEGNEQFPTPFLESRLTLGGGGSFLSRLPFIGGSSEKGDPVFDTHAWSEATEKVQQLYRNSGFLYAQVNPIVERLPEGEDGLPRVGLKWEITEGEQAYVSLVNILGNTTTHERVIRDRLTLLPGDVYGDERLVSSYQTMQGLGFFEPLPPNEALDIRPNEKGNINVSFRVKEKQTGNINFGASLSPSAGVAGFIGYEQPNLFGQAKSGRFRWVFGSRTNDIELGYSDPAVLGSRNSFGVSLRSSRDQFSYVGLGRRRQTGGSVIVGTPFLGARWTRLSLRYSLFRDEYDGDEDELDLDQRQLLNVGTRSSLELRLTRDTRNHPLFPTAGNRNMVALQKVGGFLGGDGDYNKFTFETEWYTPIARLRSDPSKTPIDLALGVSARGGMILGDNPFFLERFFMGGVQYGPPLRGYDELTITPLGHVPNETPGFSRLDRVGGSFFGLYTTLGLNLGGNFFINAFYDAGNVWRTAEGFNPTDLFRGVGVGVTVVTPVGPLGLDYAYALDARDAFGNPNPGWKLHFRFGQIF
jgi:outer membrane protein insertion porin family